MSIKERVKKVIHESLGAIGTPDDIRSKHKIAEDLGADSLDQVELLIDIESEFDIVITDDEAEQVETVGDCVAYVESHAEKNP